jgi:LPXTG-motif cell wall-anchored protein
VSIVVYDLKISPPRTQRNAQRTQKEILYLIINVLQMKKTIVRLALAIVLMLNIASLSLAQKPKADKDTVNADKAAKPVFYQASEDEDSSKGGSSSTIIGIAVGVIVAGGVAFMLRKKKK